MSGVNPIILLFVIGLFSNSYIEHYRGIHFDSTGVHDTDEISGLIKILLEQAWLNQHGNESLVSFGDMKVVKPRLNI